MIKLPNIWSSGRVRSHDVMCNRSLLVCDSCGSVEIDDDSKLKMQEITREEATTLLM